MPAGTIAALAAGSLSFAKVHAHDEETLQKTENVLEKEICRETKAPPKGSVAKIRHHGERFLHSKHVLMAVVVLNIIDCILVMGELIFDIHYIVDVLEKSEKLSDNFLNKMDGKYPFELKEVDDIGQLYTKILHSSIQWNTQNTTQEHIKISFDNSSLDNSPYNIRHKRDSSIPNTDNSADTNIKKKKKRHKEHTIEENIAHGFHKASITILAILVIETGFKIFCFGKHLLDNKLEVFDSIIVIASFILDLVFIKGITIYSIQEFVFILAFLVPWRVLRVVNSLIVAIIDHEHFRMKLLYKQKKQISVQVKESKKELKLYEKNLQALEQLCLAAGIPEFKVRNCTRELKNRKKKSFGSFGSLQQIVTFKAVATTPMMADYEHRNGSVDTLPSSIITKSMDDIYKT